VLIKKIDERIQYGDRMEVKNPTDANELLGFCSALNTIAACVAMELQHGGGKVSPDMVNLSTRVIQAMDRYAGKARGFAGDPFVQRLEEFGRKYQTQLMTKVVSALRAAGDRAQADEFIKQHEAIIKERGIPLDEAHTNPPAPRMTPTSVDVEGRTLAATLLLVRYYDALSRKEPMLLQGCLTADSKPAAAILAERDREVKAKGDFDTLDSVKVDAKTTLKIAADSATPAEFVVTVADVVKTFRKAGQAIVRRESDQFRFRLVDGGYRVVVPIK